MELQAKVIQILPESRGQSKNGGEWVKNAFVVETTEEQYPKKVCLSVMGEERWQHMNIVVGSTYNFGIDIESREWNGRWFTEAKCWRVIPPAANNPVPQAPASTETDIPF